MANIKLFFVLPWELLLIPIYITEFIFIKRINKFKCNLSSINRTYLYWQKQIYGRKANKNMIIKSIKFPYWEFRLELSL